MMPAWRRRPGAARTSAPQTAPDGSSPRDRGRAGPRLGRRLRLRLAVRPAGLRGRRRLDDAVGLAVPVRRRAHLVLPVAVGRSARAASARLDRRAIVAALGLGVLYVGNSGTYYASLETVSPSLAALVVYLYPAIVAVLSLRFGHRLSGRRAWIALGISLCGVVLAVGGIDPDESPPVSGPAPRVRLVLHLRRVGHPGGAAVRRAARGRRDRGGRRRLRDGDRRPDHDRDRDRLLGVRSGDVAAGPAGADSRRRPGPGSSASASRPRSSRSRPSTREPSASGRRMPR